MIKEPTIKGGYYIKARCIQESEIAHAPPHVREIWDWLIKECNHKPRKLYGRIIERGQRLTSYKEIQEALHWMIGWRKKQYSKSNCETAMKLLKKHAMVTTEKTTRGFLVTVCNYDHYQNPDNYGNDKASYKTTTLKPQPDDTINNNEKNLKNLKKIEIPSWIPEKEWNDFLMMRADNKRLVTESNSSLLIKKLMELDAAGEDLKEVLNYSIRNSYPDLYSQKQKQQNNKNTGTRQTEGSNKDEEYDKLTH